MVASLLAWGSQNQEDALRFLNDCERAVGLIADRLQAVLEEARRVSGEFDA